MGDKMRVERMLDANFNRVSEGLRVIEDCLRFVYEEKTLQDRVRILKHKIRKTIETEIYICYRNSEEDIGLHSSQNSSVDTKSNLKDLMKANFKRAQEGLRTIEEGLKILGKNRESKCFEGFRFECYQLEKECVLLRMFPNTDIYGIVSEKFSNGKTNYELAMEMLEANIKIIQYREKSKTKIEKIEDCKKIIEVSKDRDSILIVNDDIDVAILTGADGVHLGQDDLPIEYARKLAPNLIIGVSTHNKEQVLRAVKMGADYIGVGPIFNTHTKPEVEKSEGIEFLRWVKKNVQIPFVAIGGINIDNISSVKKQGGSCFAMISELVKADCVEKKVNEIRRKLEETNL